MLCSAVKCCGVQWSGVKEALLIAVLSSVYAEGYHPSVTYAVLACSVGIPYFYLTLLTSIV